MKILFLQSTSEIGGSDVALLGLIEDLDRERFSACVLLPAEGPAAAALRAAGCRVVAMPGMLKLTDRLGAGYLLRYALGYPGTVLRIARLIRREGVDLVHTNSLHNLYGFAAALLARRPHVWHAREIVAQSRWLRLAETTLARMFSARIVTVSAAVAGMFRGSARLAVLADTVDTERFHPRADGSAVRAELGIPAGAPVIGLAARLDRSKGAETFVRAAALCLRRRPEARFLIAGGAVAGQEDFEVELRGLARALGLGEALCMAGWRYGPDRMPEVYAAMDALVVPSLRPEGLGLAALEAMASGKPVIAARHGGVLETCVEGETALFVPPGDADALAAAMAALIEAPARARAMGVAGRRRAARYDRRAGRGRIEAIYSEAAA